MEYDFLKHFWKRMKHTGMYALLVQNSFQKTTWKQYGFAKNDEQINLLFAVMLYIMEQSLKDEICTMDDIGAYIDELNIRYFQKELTYETSKALGEFVINVVLCNEGKPMYFDCYDFEQKEYKSVNISFVANRISYMDSDVRRTSYYLTDDGYNLILSTLEIESNMKLTIHEMIFQLHLEKASYDKAVDEIKNIFNLLRIQLQKIREAMGRIRRNALSYSVADYQEILEENLNTIEDTKKKFQNYREVVKARAKDLEEENINVRKLKASEEEALKNLKVIETYLNKAIDEHQKILNSHFDLKALYTKELELLSQMSLIKRFGLRNELYEKVMEEPKSLDRMELFLSPLFNRKLEKIYNLNKALEFQRPVKGKASEEEDSLQEYFDEEQWELEQEERLKQKLLKYESSLRTLLSVAVKKGSASLEEIRVSMEGNVEKLIPNTEIFKEIMVELLKYQSIDLRLLKKERSENISETGGGFQLNEMLLNLVEKEAGFENIHRIEAYRERDGKTVLFDDVKNEEGEIRHIKCSNVVIRVMKEG